MARCTLCGTTSGALRTLHIIACNEQHWFRGPGYSKRIQAHLLRREGKVAHVAVPWAQTVPWSPYGRTLSASHRWVLTTLGQQALACVHRYPPQPPSAAVRRGEPRGRLARVHAIPVTVAEVPGRVGRAWPVGSDTSGRYPVQETPPIEGLDDIHAFLREESWKHL